MMEGIICNGTHHDSCQREALLSSVRTLYHTHTCTHVKPLFHFVTSTGRAPQDSDADVVAEEACRIDQGAEKCKRAREYVVEVFGWMDSIDRPW